ncbi:unnamed protein product, partial [Sphacelaria rigidula]
YLHISYLIKVLGVMNSHTYCNKMNNQGEPSVAQLIRSIRKFDGTNFLEWKRSTRAMISLTHPGISDIMNGSKRPAETFDDVEHTQGARSVPVARPRSRSTPPHTRSQGTA